MNDLYAFLPNILTNMNSDQSAESRSSANDSQVSTPEENDKTKVLKSTPPAGGTIRTPLTKKVHSHFKSPLHVAGSAKVNPAEEVAELERRREELDLEIAQLEEDCSEGDHHTRSLHTLWS
ncbi:DNA repair protein SWI5 homolog isoform X2 [Cololabis saira]|uniref:DNA repair protein SWI5 homolog isoform X2 n=1 Tax=Cololabis saira TaxID=129043 RepID=UPI002AD42A87|nr:DNA repair protein SWI5 homolog isoform X2 [Cololabis saira]